jgi:probable HAF family extracellular repeat protein
MTRAFRIGALLTFIVVSGNTSPAQTPYTVVDLGDLGGGSSVAYGINDRMQVVGESVDSTTFSRAFLWERGRMVALRLLPGGSFSAAYDINNRGQVVGTGESSPGMGHAVLWQRGRVIDLGTLPGGTFAIAYAINTKGQIVGVSDNQEGFFRAAVWEDGQASDLGTLAGSEGAEAYDINNKGHVVGKAYMPAGLTRAVLWDGGDIVDLGTLPGDDFSEAYGINDAGHVVGRSGNIALSRERAFIWEDGVMREIPAPGTTFSRGLDVNRRLQVAGVAGTPDTRAALFEDGSVNELPNLPDGEVSLANAINRLGHIAGVSGMHAALWLRQH